MLREEKSGLTAYKVQRAVDDALSWTQKGGRTIVTGIQEQGNGATADIRFDSFEYNADQMGTPVSEHKSAPQMPDINSPNCYEEVYR